MRAVYFIRDNDDKMAFLCRGVLMDYLRTKGYKVIRDTEKKAERVVISSTGYQVVIHREILTCSDEEYLQLLQSDDKCIAKIPNQDRTWRIYKVPKEDELWGIDRRKNDDGRVKDSRRVHEAEIRELNIDSIPHVSLPVRAVFKRNHQKKLYCRINFHPETEGLMDSGKIYFPDKDWTDVTEGEAEITYYFDNKRCGFVYGTMCKRELLDDDKVLAWMCDNLTSYQLVIRVLDSPHGNYYGIYDITAAEYRIVEEVDNNIQARPFYDMVNDIAQTESAMKTLNQTVLDKVFGEGYSTVESYMKGFTRSVFDPYITRPQEQISTDWETISGVEGYNLVTAAIKDKIIEVRRSLTINKPIACPLSTGIKYIYKWTKEDLLKLAEDIKLINSKFDADAKALLDEGKIRLCGM